MVILLVLLVALVGLLLYGFAVNPKVIEIGRIMFWTGLLAFLFNVASAHMVNLFSH